MSRYPVMALSAATSAWNIVLDVSDADKERLEGRLPPSTLFGGAETMTWYFAFNDNEVAGQFHAQIVQPATVKNIPAIEMDKSTKKSAVATVFEKVKTREVCNSMCLSCYECLGQGRRRCAW